jgi:hypothetical protein
MMAVVRHGTPPLLTLATLLLTGLLGVAALAPGGRPSAHASAAPVPFGPYLRRADGHSADPVNVIFTGEGDAAVVALTITRVLRWLPVAGSDMAFSDHGETLWAELQLGTPSQAGIRRHIRLAGAEEPSERWVAYTLAGVHHDLDVPCGHLGVAFDEERNALAQAMEEAGFRVTWLWLGNDGPVEHCTGAVTHGDGWAAVIELRRADASPSPSATTTPAATTGPSPTTSPIPSPSATPVPTVSPSPSSTPTPTPAPTPEPPRPGADTPVS